MRFFYRAITYSFLLAYFLLIAFLAFGFAEAFGEGVGFSLVIAFAIALVFTLPVIIYYWFRPGLAEVAEQWNFLAIIVIMIIVGSTWIGERVFG